MVISSRWRPGRRGIAIVKERRPGSIQLEKYASHRGPKKTASQENYRAAEVPRIFATGGADRNAFRSGSSVGSVSASIRIVAQLHSRWRCAKSPLPQRL
jgi:hypothetical protein